jgi:opacity protein-like surface antigen
MKQVRIIISIFPLLCLVMLLHASTGSAEELFRQFSLGGGNLTTAPSDAKAPEPGIVTAKYGFRVARDFLTYMGTGLAYTYQPDAQTGDKTKIRTGVAAQFGFSYLLGESLILNMDYKYLTVSPELQRGDPRTPPQSLGIGLQIKF